jgi:hypothetical protein
MINAFLNGPGHSLTDLLLEGKKMDSIHSIQNLISPLAELCYSNSGQAH